MGDNSSGDPNIWKELPVSTFQIGYQQEYFRGVTSQSIQRSS